MIRVYGASDDLVEIEGSQYEAAEIGCYNGAVQIGFVDGTQILLTYGKCDLAIWKIEVLVQGARPYELTLCNDEGAEIYSDIFEIDAEVAWHEVFDA